LIFGMTLLDGGKQRPIIHFDARTRDMQIDSIFDQVFVGTE
jgi:hypothetical protein